MINTGGISLSGIKPSANFARPAGGVVRRKINFLEDDCEDGVQIKKAICKKKKVTDGSKKSGKIPDVFSRLYSSSKRKNGVVSKFAAPRMARSLRGSPTKPKFSFGGSKNVLKIR